MSIGCMGPEFSDLRSRMIKEMKGQEPCEPLIPRSTKNIYQNVYKLSMGIGTVKYEKINPDSWKYDQLDLANVTVLYLQVED